MSPVRLHIWALLFLENLVVASRSLSFPGWDWSSCSLFAPWGLH